MILGQRLQRETIIPLNRPCVSKIPPPAGAWEPASRAVPIRCPRPATCTITMIPHFQPNASTTATVLPAGLRVPAPLPHPATPAVRRIAAQAGIIVLANGTIRQTAADPARERKPAAELYLRKRLPLPPPILPATPSQHLPTRLQAHHSLFPLLLFPQAKRKQPAQLPGLASPPTTRRSTAFPQIRRLNMLGQIPAFLKTTERGSMDPQEPYLMRAR